MPITVDSITATGARKITPKYKPDSVSMFGFFFSFLFYVWFPSIPINRTKKNKMGSSLLRLMMFVFILSTLKRGRVGTPLMRLSVRHN
jgi:hypothetical protein